MKCYICDREDDLIIYDKIAGGYSPCTTCQEAINECLEAFEEEESDALSPEWELNQTAEFSPIFSPFVQPSIPSGRP
jgi:hypothetical protein